MFDGLQAETEELIDAGDIVVAAIHVQARIKETDAPLDMRLAVVFTVREGKIVRGREYATRKEALQAVGLTA